MTNRLIIECFGLAVLGSTVGYFGTGLWTGNMNPVPLLILLSCYLMLAVGLWFLTELGRRLKTNRNATSLYIGCLAVNTGFLGLNFVTHNPIGCMIAAVGVWISVFNLAVYLADRS